MAVSAAVVVLEVPSSSNFLMSAAVCDAEEADDADYDGGGRLTDCAQEGPLNGKDNSYTYY